jgi:flagellar basal body P-ring formation chaperone FlgA
MGRSEQCCGWLMGMSVVAVSTILSTNLYATSLNSVGCEASVPAGASLPANIKTAPTQRLVSVTQDTLLRSRWALLVDCQHPEWPARMMLLPKEVDHSDVAGRVAPVRSARTQQVAASMVRAGETVRLWRRDAVASLETTAVAEESGDVGKRIRVRLLRRGIDSEEAPKQLAGVIDGAGSVEMVQ